jgi:ribosomal-protein-alanine N-acetyltransferase
VVNWVVPPSAWIGGVAVSWSEGEHYGRHLDLLLPAIERAAASLGARHLYYSGADTEGDWLRSELETRDFSLVGRLRSYDKADYAIAAEGNTDVRVRPFAPADLPGVLEIEQEAFPQHWRHDAASFLQVAGRYPYFVVAEDDSGIVGYQFNTVDGAAGYLVRIAVRSCAASKGIGTRLMAEAIRYFAAHRVARILLNAEEQNTRAHALYERFGFYRVPSQGFVLSREIA